MTTGGGGLTVYLPHVESLPLPPEETSVGSFEYLAANDRFGIHALVDRPEDADIILFTEFHFLRDWRAREIRFHPVRRRFPESSYCYDERDYPWPALPGIFVGERADRLIGSFQVPWFFAAPSDAALELMSKPPVEPDLLFSFVGSPTSPLRDTLFCMPPHPRGLIERVDGFQFFEPGSRDFVARIARHVELVRRSKFVLCPYGHGPATLRVYEAMAAGRVPVILSDEWLPPVGPDWGSFSVRWPERMALQVPAFLESIEDRYEAMARGALRAFGEWYRPEVSFHSVVEALRPLVDGRIAMQFPFTGVRRWGYIQSALSTVRGRARVGGARYRDWFRSLTG